MAPVLKSGLHSPNGGLARHPLAGSSSSLSALVAEYTTLSVLTRIVLGERLRRGLLVFAVACDLCTLLLTSAVLEGAHMNTYSAHRT